MRLHALRPRRLAALLLAATTLAGCAGEPGAVSSSDAPATLVSPDSAVLAAAAPDSFTVTLETSEGAVTILARRAWSPRGADRLHWLASSGFLHGARFFRVLPGFVVQFGLSGMPAVDQSWESRAIPDDPVLVPNRRGTVVFATAGPDTRTTQLFINLADNAQLDAMGFAPVGEVIAGMDAVDRMFAGYGEGPPMGTGPDQGRIMRQGNSYLRAEFPSLDSIVRSTVGPGAP